MASESLLPLVKNQALVEPQKYKNSLNVAEEIGYGEQLSTFTEIEQGLKTKPLFSSQQPILKDAN